MRLRSHLLEYFLATSTTSSNKPLSRVVGFKPNSIKHLLSTIRSFSTASFLGFGKKLISAPVKDATFLANSPT